MLRGFQSVKLAWDKLKLKKLSFFNILRENRYFGKSQFSLECAILTSTFTFVAENISFHGLRFSTERRNKACVCKITKKTNNNNNNNNNNNMNKIIKRQEILPTYRSNQPKDLLNNNISVAFTKCIKSQDRNWVPRKSAAVIMYDDCKIYILFVAAAKFTQYVG